MALTDVGSRSKDPGTLNFTFENVATACTKKVSSEAPDSARSISRLVKGSQGTLGSVPRGRGCWG